MMVSARVKLVIASLLILLEDNATIALFIITSQMVAVQVSLMIQSGLSFYSFY